VSVKGLLQRSVVAVVMVAMLCTGCAGKKKKAAAQPDGEPGVPISVETYERGIEYLTQSSMRQAKRELENVEYEPGSDIRGQIEPLARVGLADVTFYGGGNTMAYIDARNLYLDFVTLYGDHPLAPYAQTQVGLCSLKQVNEPTRDQSQTWQAIQDLESVMQRWPGSPFVVAAQGFRRTARSSLAEAEFRVGRFYLKKKAYTAAIDRFRGIVAQFPDFIEIEKVKYYLGKTLVSEGDSVEGRLILDQLVVENPNGPYTESAKKVLEAAGGSFRTDVEGS